jgi:hypothetical protein
LQDYRGWINAVRYKFNMAIIPGRELVIDESMIENKNHDNADCLTYIPRKPQPYGYELWTLVDVKSGICVNFEMNEGKEVTQLREYVAQYGATTATTLRICRPYFDTWRLIYGDS